MFLCYTGFAWEGGGGWFGVGVAEGEFEVLFDRSDTGTELVELGSDWMPERLSGTKETFRTLLPSLLLWT